MIKNKAKAVAVDKTDRHICGAADKRVAFVRRSPEVKQSDIFSTIERFLSVRSIDGEMIQPARVLLQKASSDRPLHTGSASCVLTPQIHVALKAGIMADLRPNCLPRRARGIRVIVCEHHFSPSS